METKPLSLQVLRGLQGGGLPIRIHEADIDPQGRIHLAFDINPPATPPHECHIRLKTFITYVREELQGNVAKLTLKIWEKTRKEGPDNENFKKPFKPH